MLAKSDGITVLICTHNGERNISETLKHLAVQKNLSDIKWEILIINNACNDNTVETARRTWNNLHSPTLLLVADEPLKGKDRAIDLGFKMAQFKYVIICDDDNWLDDTYLYKAHCIMKSDSTIGMLGGFGIPEFETDVPSWFNGFRMYYAVGEQNITDGEIRHYWPTYQFLWGAGAVINIEAYNLLISCGFERILSSKKYPKVARSEDVELCFAIWLTGYKIWYNNSLTYKHFIGKDKLKWNKMYKIIRYSNAAMHYLRPYNILIFTGHKDAPPTSFWRDYIIYFLKASYQEFRTVDGLKNLSKIMLGKHKTDHTYFKKAAVLHQFYDAVTLWRGYHHIFKKVKLLQKKLNDKKQIILN